MNQLIKKLLEESTEVQDDWKTGLSVYVVNHKTFAELIVQECIDIISPYTLRMGRPGEECLHPIQEIKKHFGMNP